MLEGVRARLEKDGEGVCDRIWDILGVGEVRARFDVVNTKREHV